MRNASNRPRLTPWFSGATPPWHEGVYQRRFPGGPYSCWDGRHWRQDAVSPQAAAIETQPSRWQQAAWRGSTEPPPGHCLTCRGAQVLDLGDDAETGQALIDPCPDC
ncbi:hypothetical protein M8A51_16825 [Schlegelella sp. S2-27]|uniref:DUF2510 domain-containing protein n=1 Tax=Caldimonas mangrovi TaxID=2944811 RepID=A0ABT0YRC5_9BURK|nr:hypothetical protein [Caldimonas mangrovi]MCM5681193.1 hypothetical protein [Caldimonas mangrovi]